MKRFGMDAVMYVALLGVTGPGQAFAQVIFIPPAPPVIVNVPDRQQTALRNREIAIRQQQLELERTRAEDDARRAAAEAHRRSVEAQTSHGPTTITSYSDLAVGNPLAGSDALTCSQGSGTVIQVTGRLRGDGCR